MSFNTVFRQFDQLRHLLLVSSLALAALAGGPAWAQSDVIERESRGVIHEIYRDINQLVIDGVRYRVAIDASVDIRGVRSTFALLRTDMKVAFVYRVFEDAREIFQIEQLPDNTVLEEV